MSLMRVSIFFRTASSAGAMLSGPAERKSAIRYQHVTPESLSPIYSDGESDEAASDDAYVCPLCTTELEKSVMISVSAALILLSSDIRPSKSIFMKRSSPSHWRSGSDLRRQTK